MDLKKLAREINRTYGEPFLPGGLVKAKVFERENGEEYLNLQIGDRDASFDQNLKGIGAGTAVGAGAQWEIHRVREAGVGR